MPTLLDERPAATETAPAPRAGVVDAREATRSAAAGATQATDALAAQPRPAPAVTTGVGPGRTAVVASVALHLLFALGLVLLPARFAEQLEKPRKIDIVFYAPETLEPLLAVVEPQPPAPQSEPREVPPPPPVEVAEVHVPEPRRTPPPQPLPEPPRRREPRSQPVVEQPAAPKPQVRTDLFAADRPAAAPTAAPRREARSAGFETPTIADDDVGVSNPRVVAAGSFGGGKVSVPVKGTPRPAVGVSSGGFGDAPVGAAEPALGRSAGDGSGAVQAAGFGSGVAAAPAPRERERRVEAPDTPVEIVSKARPVYTEQARERRIEGEVVLEVAFLADGRLRVLRVVDGLGHGLDETAVDAAKQIEFKPARRAGRAVDHTATLRVVFRLA